MTTNEMPGIAVLSSMCQCNLAECICGMTERVLRHWASGRRHYEAMTPEQREWCLLEIDSVEGYSRKDHESDTDPLLAQAVLNAWQDYCRAKGLL